MARIAKPKGFSLVVEPLNLCNLACAYCVREDAHLHKDPASYISTDLLQKVLRGARETCGASSVSFSGGEPTLHPRFAELLDVVVEEGYQFGLVSNGWHFGRVRSALRRHREAVRVIGFSIDGNDERSHDAMRGKGSFRRLMSAVADCHESQLPFLFKAVLHRDNASRIEPMALLAARLGAQGIAFAHLLPTSAAAERSLALTSIERLKAEREVATMKRILNSDISFAAGFVNLDPAPPCRVLSLNECNIDYAGRMSLCCNISGFRGGVNDRDIVADLNDTSFAEAWQRITEMVALQNKRRMHALAVAGPQPGFRVTSPCELCLTHFDKTPWRHEGTDPLNALQ